MLQIENLNIAYDDILTVKNVNLKVEENEIVGIVGESGSGKSTLIRSIIQLLNSNGKIVEGSILYKNKDLRNINNNEMRKVRGKEISMIFQHPELSLDPMMSIEKLFYESINVHEKISKKESYKRATEILEVLGFEDPIRVLKSYPFELSGGMCQRVMIGIAMVNNPSLLLADEPTSALDVTVQLQVVETLMQMRDIYKTSILIVTHNMGVVSKMVDKIGVMYNGEIVEWGSKEDVLRNPKHPYTKALISAIPKMDGSMPEVVEYCG